MLITREVSRVLRWQSILVLLTSFAFVMFSKNSILLDMVSVWLGGGIALVSALLYAFFAHTTRRLTPQELLKQHFRAEGVKLFATMAMFVVVLLFFEAVSGLALLGGFISAQAAYWISLLYK